MVGTFVERIGHLAREIGFGDLRGRVEFDQIYAAYQHNDLSLKHPHGGQGNYLGGTLLENSGRYMRMLADMAVTPDGSQLEDAMVAVVEDLSARSESRAPIQFGNLRNSGHPSVTDRGSVVYDRPPRSPRLSEAEIRAERGRL